MPGLTDLIVEQARQHAHKPAFVYDAGDGFVDIPYSGFIQQVYAVARELHRLGCQPGDKVALLADNSPHWCAAYLGIHCAGMTVVPLDAGYTEREVSTICEFVKPAAAVCDQAHAGLLPAVVKRRIPVDHWTFEDQGPTAQPVPLRDGQPMSIIFTSGTTGEPKGVMLSEANIASNIDVMLEGRFLRTDDRVLLMLPLHHVYACTVTFLCPLCQGGTLIFPRSLKGEDIAFAVREQGITVFPTVPQVLGLFRKKIRAAIDSAPPVKRVALSCLVFLNRCLRIVGINASRVLLRSVHRSFPRLRFFASGGARLEPEVYHDLRRLGFTLVEAYGLTETSPMVTMNTPRKQTPGSVGRALPNVEVRIDRSDPAFEAGEVCVRGPNVMMGYYEHPEATAEVVKDGWFHTGDLGHLDKRGYLFLTGRAKEVIVLPSGKNIYPEELEKHYAAPEAIEEACVLALPGREGGKENLTALVYPNMAYFRRYKAGNLLQDVKYEIETAALQLPSYQRVTRVELAPEPFPRTRLSKLKRYQIRQDLEERLAGAAPGPQAKKPTKTDDPLLHFIMDELELSSVPVPKSNLETDLGLDSLSKLELLAAFEKRFAAKISDDDATGIMTIEDLRRFVSDTLVAAETGATPDDTPASLAALRQDPVPALHEHVDTGHGGLGAMFRLGGYSLMRMLLRSLFRLRVSGLEHLPARGPFILAANHTSYFDAFVTYGMLPYRVAGRMFSLSLPQIFGRFPLSLIRKPTRVILTGTHDTTVRSIQYCAKVLQAGQPICIFPEGKRSADGLVDRPKRGVGMLSHECRAPIVPVYISGANDLLSRSNPGFRIADIRVQICPPIDPSQPGERILEEWFAALKAQERREK